MYYKPSPEGAIMKHINLAGTNKNAQMLAYWVTELKDALGKIQWDLVDNDCKNCREISAFANTVRLRCAEDLEKAETVTTYSNPVGLSDL